MRRVFALILLFVASNIYAQDTLTKKSGEVILIKLMEIDSSEIKFKRYDDLNGPVYIISKSDVATIHAAGPEILNKEISKATAHVYDSLYAKGQMDALRYYYLYHDAGTGTLVISLLSPLAGLIPAVGCSVTPPKVKNLTCPNTTLFNSNMGYYKGYTDRARKIKTSKVWTNWLVGFGVNAVVVIVLVTSR